jgi:hypothetical protein
MSIIYLILMGVKNILGEGVEKNEAHMVYLMYFVSYVLQFSGVNTP